MHSVYMILLRSVGLIFVTIGALLVLLRPTRMLWAFYVYALGVSSFDTSNIFWSFLPDNWYTPIVLARFVLIAGTSVAFLVFALRFPNDTVAGWRRWLEYASPFIFVWLVYVWPYAYVYNLFVLGRQPQTVLSIPYPYFFMATDALAAIVLIVNYRCSAESSRQKLKWMMAALITSYAGMHIDALAYLSPSIPNWLIITGNVLGVFVPLSVAYAIIRHRVFDITFVINRIVEYVLITLVSIAVFTLIDLVFIKTMAGFAIPVELILAVWLGLRLSGLDDVAVAVNLTETEAQAARALGDRSAERDALARALARAERTRNPGLIASVRAHSAFGAWFAGDDEELRQHARALDKVVGDQTMQGLGRFASFATGKPLENLEERRELPDWAARTHLLACGTVDDAIEAWRQAEHAMAMANASGNSFLQVIARVALAEFSVEKRADLYEAAMACSRESGMSLLSDAVGAVSRGDKHLGILGPFVTKRLRAPRASRATLEVRFADVSVYSYGRPVDLKQRELSLLLAVSRLQAGASSDAIQDLLWPDLDGDAAHNAFRASLHRLRKSLGDDAAVVRDGSRYRVRDGTAVDLWSMTAFVTSAAKSKTLDENQRTALRKMFHALCSGRSDRPVRQEWFAGIERAISRLARDAGQKLAEDALACDDGSAAGIIASALIEADPLDEMPRRLAIKACLAVGDRDGAIYEYNQYVGSLSRASLGGPSADLTDLVPSSPSANQGAMKSP